MRHLRTILRDRRGATAIEYALIASLISIAAIVGFKNLGTQIDNTLGNVNTAMDGAT